MTISTPSISSTVQLKTDVNNDRLVIQGRMRRTGNKGAEGGERMEFPACAPFILIVLFPVIFSDHPGLSVFFNIKQVVKKNNSWRFHLKTDEKRMTLKKERQRKGNKMRRTKNFWAGTDINPETDTKTITTLYTESEHERRRQKNDDDTVKKNRWNECSRSASNDLFPDLRAAFADSFYKKRGTLDWSSVRERESFAERIACLLPDPC